jgi:hypothetical protein
MDCIFTSKRNYQLMTRRESADDRRLPAKVSTYMARARLRDCSLYVQQTIVVSFVFSADVAISVA